MTRRLAAALFVAALAAAAAPAQPPPANPYGQPSPYGPPPGTPAPRTPPVSQPPASLQAGAGLSAPPVGAPPVGYGPPPVGGYYPPYGVPYIESPAGGYLRGVADVTTANGYYLSQVQQARQLQTQADMSKLDLRRRMVEQQRYLKSLEPTPEEIRQKDILDAINRSRRNPPPTEIWSGKALNDLLIAVQREARGGNLGPAVPVDPRVLQHINFTTGTTAAGTGAVKEFEHPQWPLPLLDDAFKAGRERFDQLAARAVEQATSTQIDPRLIRDLKNDLNGMLQTAKAKIDDMTPTEYVQATRYLRELNDAVRVLQDPNVANYFTGRFRATGATVGDLTRDMTSRGLSFAPATSGGESYYTALYQALVTYEAGLSQYAAR